MSRMTQIRDAIKTVAAKIPENAKPWLTKMGAGAAIGAGGSIFSDNTSILAGATAGALGGAAMQAGGQFGSRFIKNKKMLNLASAGLGIGAGAAGFSTLSSNESINNAFPNSFKQMGPQDRLKYQQALLDQKLKYNEINDARKHKYRMEESKLRKELWQKRQNSRHIPSSWTTKKPWQ